MRGNRALAKARATDDEEGEGILSLPPLGLRFWWADPTGGATEALARTQDEFSVRIRILRAAIDAIRPLAEEVHEGGRALTELLRGPAPDPEAIDALQRAIDERRAQINRLGRAAVNRCGGGNARLVERSIR
jgi:hypothetical protein